MNNTWWIVILVVASILGYYIGYQDGVDNPPVYEDYRTQVLESDRYIALLESRVVLMNTLVSNMGTGNSVLIEKIYDELKANKLRIDIFQDSTSALEFSQLAP